ncbi:segregation/condensation protein A [Candidatus Uhrbacteria bacterium]|nr:segregation/condensation protein A [Candidatus Uhrbacteria bacterium]
MPFAVKVEQFEGPLDLLLSMIEEEELDITKVSLAKIADEFVEHVKAAKLPPEEVADFLLTASKLLLIKSQALFPNLPLEDEGPALESQLKLLKLYHDASRVIEQMIKQKHFVYFREKMPVERVFRPPQKLKAGGLREAFLAVIKTLEPLVRIPKTMVMKAISISERIQKLRDLILEKLTTSFRSFVGGQAGDKTEVIVSFLALLELCKQRLIEVKQEKIFHDIMIERKSPPG